MPVRTPVTTLDQRYSGPGAVATRWDETRRALEMAELSWITTVRPDGRPHVTPLVAVWTDDALYFCTGARERKTANLNASPHVIVTTGCNRWDEGLDVVVEGDAVRVTDDDALKRLAVAWTGKWDGQWQYAVREGSFRHQNGQEVGTEPVYVYAVQPTRVLAFTKGTFSHTTHRF
jgi:nitroimidazol reductase NimA-like FMN-containing flavoprotein (pyridoxamine 5'-phosphate oxidase superfamily)